jgi:hypothetical protein
MAGSGTSNGTGNSRGANVPREERVTGIACVWQWSLYHHAGAAGIALNEAESLVRQVGDLGYSGLDAKTPVSMDQVRELVTEALMCASASLRDITDLAKLVGLDIEEVIPASESMFPSGDPWQEPLPASVTWF